MCYFTYLVSLAESAIISQMWEHFTCLHMIFSPLFNPLGSTRTLALLSVLKLWMLLLHIQYCRVGNCYHSLAIIRSPDLKKKKTLSASNAVCWIKYLYIPIIFIYPIDDSLHIITQSGIIIIYSPVKKQVPLKSSNSELVITVFFYLFLLHLVEMISCPAVSNTPVVHLNASKFTKFVWISLSVF